MLTLVQGQVNAVAMVDNKSQQISKRTAPQSLAVKLLQPLLERRRPERMLVLKHAAAGDLQLAPISPVQIVHLSTDATAENAVLHGRLSALPFEGAAFDLVVLHHLVGDGSEDVLQEALRVLVPGGDIVISGLNSAGLRYRVGNRAEQFPGLRLNRIIFHLKTQSFKIERCLRMGLACMSRPMLKNNWFAGSWYALALPCMDWVVLHGHHQANLGNASILRFRQARRRRVSSAALDGVSSRKAAS